MWNIEYLPEVKRDLKELDGSQIYIVRKAIDKVSKNPLPASEGGYGKPLGNKNGIQLSGCYKIKIKKEGIRVVYKLVREEEKMRVVIVGARADSEVYEEAAERIKKNNL